MKNILYSSYLEKDAGIQQVQVLAFPPDKMVFDK